MSEPSPTDPAPIDQNEHHVLDYRRPADLERHTRPPRRHLPPKFAFGFLAAVGILCFCWPLVSEMPVRHLVLFIAVGLVSIGLVLLSIDAMRLAGAGILCAVALWLLLVGACSGIGFVRPGLF